MRLTAARDSRLSFRVMDARTLRLPALAALLATAAPLGAGMRRPIDVSARDLPLQQLFLAICQQARINVYLGPELAGKKGTVQLSKVDPLDALKLVCKLHKLGIAVTPDEGTVLIGAPDVIDGLDVAATRVIKLAHQDPDKAAAILNKVYAGRLQAIADPHSGSVVVVPLKR